jgi:hypothetical protein
LGVDMATGTGWPFGGADRERRRASSRIALQSTAGSPGIPTQMKVKRAAPGGEGLVLDPYSVARSAAICGASTARWRACPCGHHAVPRFLRVLQRQLDATPPREIPEINGYDLEPFAAQLLGEKPLDADTLSRIKGDYRRTLAQLHLDYVSAWVDGLTVTAGSRATRRIGAPGNLLDLYAGGRHPETESYRLHAAADSRACGRRRRRQLRSRIRRSTSSGDSPPRRRTSPAPAGLERDV